MKRGQILSSISSVLIALAVACGDQQQKQTFTITSILPEKLESIGAERMSGVRLFVGDSLWQYIDGGAELYHQFRFVEVATADYSVNGLELVADVYRFQSADDAYGLFSMLRPDDPEVADLGVEASVSPSTLEFVKGSFLVRLLGFEESPATSTAIASLAGALEQLVPGTTEHPAAFALFPDSDRIVYTDRIQASSYLGQAFLTDVYTQDYLSAGDTVTMFLTWDESGEKYRRWSGQAETSETADEIISGIPFDEGQGITVVDSYYGRILAGRKSTWLAGVVGFSDNQKSLLAAWIDSLP